MNPAASASFPTVPPVPGPPFDPTSLLLNGRVGWNGQLDHIEHDGADAALVLALRPDARRTLTEPSGSFGGLVAPANVALGPQDELYLLDQSTLLLKRFDRCTCAFVALPCLGGEGGGARQLRNPHGIAIRGADLFICDTGLAEEPGRGSGGNHRVSVFALKGFGLRGHLRAPIAHYPYWEPYGVAFDSRKRIFVTDRANGLVHRFDRAGRWERALPGFVRPTRIAIDCRDRLHVLVDGGAAVRSVDGSGAPLEGATRPDRLAPYFPPMSFGVDAHGNLDLTGSCVAAGAGGWFDAHGNALAPPAPVAAPYQGVGVFLSGPLDSRIDRCQWHRIILHGEIAAGASIVVQTFAANEVYTAEQIGALAEWETDQAAQGPLAGSWDCLVRSGPARYLWVRLQFNGNGAATPRIGAMEIEFPRIGSFRYLPAVFGAEPTSADFTERFLALFDTTLRGIERGIDTGARLFDPASAPAGGGAGTPDFLSWLASWIGIGFDRQWDTAKRRRFLKAAGRLFDRRGTFDGLRQQLLMLLEFDRLAPCRTCEQPTCRCAPANCAPPRPVPAWQPPPLILEHFRLRRWLFVGAGRLGEQAMLWGSRIANRSQLDHSAQLGRTQLRGAPDPLHDPFRLYAHQFTVFVPSRWRASDKDRKALDNLLHSESPAPVRCNVNYVEPRFRIGVQAMIGFDSVIGRLPQGVALGAATLGQATLLTAPAHLEGGPSIALGREGRIGTTSFLT